MLSTDTLHPPAGATALIAVLQRASNTKWHGFLFVFLPVTSGNCLLIALAVLINNSHPRRSYPLYWW